MPVNTEATVTITLKDKDGKPITGLPPIGSITYTSSSTFKWATATETSTPGVYTFKVSNSAAENIKIEMSIADVKLNEVYLITVIP